MPRNPQVRAWDILGNAEVRRVCGRALGKTRPVTRHTLLAWREREGFPEPIRRLECGELWARAEVKAWLAARQASQGPSANA